MKDSAALMNNSSQNFEGCWIQSPQINLVEAMRTLPDLGLKLSQTQSFLDKVDQLLLQQGYSFNGRDQANSSSYAYAMANARSKDNILQHANKLKAENFLISLLRIGSWQRISRNEGDLVAKCYFAKRKLVWEFLENGLKSKIEIQWSDILSLKAVLPEGQSGILEIELTQPPSFYHEIDPQPRKHTQWRMVSDFTGGQAPTYRRHYLEFPPGALDRPLEKLLRYDNRLFQLSRQGFPTLKSPYFPTYTIGDFSLNFGGQLHINPQQLSFSNVPTHYQTYEPAPLNSPISEYGSNQMPIWEGQGGIINVEDNLITNQISGTMTPFNAAASSSLQQVNLSMSFQDNYIPLPQNQLGGLVSMQQQPSMFQTSNDHHQNVLFNNSQNGFSNSVMEGNLFLQGHLRNNINDASPNMVDNSVFINNTLSNNVVDSGHMLYPQGTNFSSDNNSFSLSVNLGDFNHEINNWTHDFNHQWQ